MEEFQFLTHQEASDSLGVTYARLTYLRRSGRVAYFDARPALYTPRDIEDFRIREAKRKAGILARKLRLKPAEGSVEHYQQQVHDLNTKRRTAQARYDVARICNREPKEVRRAWEALRIALVRLHTAQILLHKAREAIHHSSTSSPDA